VAFAAAVRAAGGGWDAALPARGVTPLDGDLGALGDSGAVRIAGATGGLLPGWSPGVLYLEPPRRDLLPLVAVGADGDSLLVWAEATALRAATTNGEVPAGWPVPVPAGAGQPLAVSLDGTGATVVFVPTGDAVLAITPRAGEAEVDTVPIPARALAALPAGPDSTAVLAGIASLGILHVWTEKNGVRSPDLEIDLGRVTAAPIVAEFEPGEPMAVAAHVDAVLPEAKQWLAFAAPEAGLVASVALDAPPIVFLSAAGNAGTGLVEAVAVDSLGGIHLVHPSGTVRSASAGGPLAGEVVCADLDGNAQADLIALRADGTLLAWEPSLQPLGGFPRHFPAGASEGPVVLDGGGGRSVVVADTAGGLWSLPFGAAGLPAPWPAPRGGASRAGSLPHDRATPVVGPRAHLGWTWRGRGAGTLCWSGAGLEDGLALRIGAGEGLPAAWEGFARDAGCIDLAGRRAGETLGLDWLGRAGGWRRVAALTLPGRAALRAGTPAPNPFRGSTTWAWEGAEGPVVLQVFDAGGRKVWEGRHAGASGEMTWSGRRADGGDAPSGVYFLRLGDGRTRAVRRVL
jgi:hypothetical protein